MRPFLFSLICSATCAVVAQRNARPLYVRKQKALACIDLK